MKTLLLLLSLTILLALPLKSAETWPGMPLRTNTVTLCWDPATAEENIDYTRIYVRHTFPVEMPQTNVYSPYSLLSEEWTGNCGTNVMEWTPEGLATNGWTLLVEIPEQLPDGTPLFVDHYTLTNTWSGSNLPAFFVITAKNALGESPFSNVAWVPAPPSHRDRSFQILSAE